MDMIPLVPFLSTKGFTVLLEWILLFFLILDLLDDDLLDPFKEDELVFDNGAATIDPLFGSNNMRGPVDVLLLRCS
jgi:hypothetical protein